MIGLFLMIGGNSQILAQTQVELPKLLRAQEQAFTKASGLSRVCVSDIFIDSKGQLWIHTCRVEKKMYVLPLVQFDGYQFIPVNTSSLKVPEFGWLKFVGLNDFDQLTGYYNRDSVNTFFTFDLTSRQPTFFSFTPFIPKEGIIRSVFQIQSGEWYYLIKVKNQFQIYERTDDSLSLKINIPYTFTAQQVISDYAHPIVESGDHLWLMDYLLPLVKWNRQTGKVKQYDQADFPVNFQLNPAYIENQWRLPRPHLALHQSDLIVCIPGYEQNQFFKLDTIQDSFVPVSGFPENWHAEGLFTDQSGNMLYLFKNEQNAYEAILEDQSRQRFDFSDLVNGKRGINNIVGQDFKKSLFICSTEGLYASTVRQASLIRHYMKDLPTRTMTQLPDGRFLVNAEFHGWFTVDDQTGQVQPFSANTCDLNPFQPHLRRKVITRPDNSIWTYRANKIYQYFPEDQTCNAFLVKNDVHDFTFINDDSIAYWNTREKTLDFLDLKTKKFSTYQEDGKDFNLYDFIQEIKYSRDGQILLTTTNGLVKIDYKNHRRQVIGYQPEFKDYRFITVHEEESGRLWMGTYMGGLHIYDPKTQEVKVIDKEKGLASNTVVSIIPDEDGDYWVCTYNGISLVSSQGEVLTNIREEEGLVEEEFNRYAYGKGKNGQILLGTIRGLNIIDAKPFKEQFSATGTPQIYLTEATFYDSEKQRDYTYRISTQYPKVIDLKANKRYLNLKFALSSYIQTDKNQYAYKIEGFNEDWIYIGSQRQLSLSNLPAGRYTLLIKGANFKGIWTPDPIKLSIYSREFFYKQSWFIITSIAFLLLVGYFWIRYLSEERKRLEKEVGLRTQQIRSDKELIEQQAQELRQLDEVKSRFFTNISHELRTPVTLISTPVDEIIKKPGETTVSQLKKPLQIVRNNARKLLDLIEELLELSRIDAGKKTLTQTPVHFYTFCRQIYSAYESKAQLNQIDYQFQYDLENHLYFLIDKKRLEKIINNLLSNALKFTPKGGKVVMQVKLRATSHQLRPSPTPPLTTHPSLLTIEVEDTGRGIPPEDLPHVFDRYFQTKRKSIPTEGGTGIGLALAKELAELMQGNLTVASKWQKGSTFSLQLPVEMVEAPELLADSTKEGISPALIQPLIAKKDKGATHPKILIVEDNPDMQQLIHSIIAEHYSCVIANNGAEAWEWLSNEDNKVRDIQLILSDIMMPQMDGYELLQSIKLHEKWRKIPVIMLTARAAEDDKLRALRLGVDDYLLKPFSGEELMARIANLMANYQQRISFLKENPPSVKVEFETTASTDDQWLQALEVAVKDGLSKKLNITAVYLSHELAISERQLSRKVRALTGLTVKQYTQEVRLQKARHLLENKTYNTIAEVSFECGFNTPGYFTTVFEKRYGKRPGEYLD